MERKQLIIDSAIELFAEKGIGSTSVQQITDRCGISKGAFYLSFKSKDELLLSIVDHFMKLFITDIDRVVKTDDPPAEKLFNYYLTTFRLIEKYAKFAKVFFKEQSHTISESLIASFMYYDQLSDELTLRLLSELYGDEIKEQKYDVLMTVKGFLRMYSPLLFSANHLFDHQTLARTLVEKTNAIARHAKIPFLTEELVRSLRQPISMDVTPDQITDEIDKCLKACADPVECESLELLKEELQTGSYRKAIVLGLLSNLKNNPSCGWLLYLLNQKL